MPSPIDAHDHLRPPHPTLRLESIELSPKRPKRPLTPDVLGRGIFARFHSREPADPGWVETIQENAQGQALPETATETGTESSGVQRVQHGVSERLGGQRHRTSSKYPDPQVKGPSGDYPGIDG